MRVLAGRALGHVWWGAMVALLVAAALGACSAAPDAGEGSGGADDPVGDEAAAEPETDPPTTEATTTEAAAAGPAAEPYFGPLTWEVVNRFPHDDFWFTQGLAYVDGSVVEGTGIWGESALRTYTLDGGALFDEELAPDDHFGEGLALAGDRLLWLTWKAEVATEYRREPGADAVVFEPTGVSFSYEGEGWGLCFDGERWIASDGSAELTFRDEATFEAIGSVEVTDADGVAVDLLNELECVAGQVWANVWQTDRVVVIDPASGEVVAHADMGGLLEPHPADDNVDAVLNGIAYRPEEGTFLLTGKFWPELVEVRFSHS